MNNKKRYARKKILKQQKKDNVDNLFKAVFGEKNIIEG